MTSEQIKDLSTLPDNWNSYGARPVDLRAIDVACGIITLIDFGQGAAVPLSRNKDELSIVQLEWHHSGIDVEIEIDGLTAPRWFYCSHGVEHEGQTIEDLIELVGRSNAST